LKYKLITDLQKMDVRKNNLRALPEYMNDLRNIEFLYAQHNDIEKLPDLSDCVNLKEVHLSNNFIKEIPENFCEKLPNLKVLDLRDNKIEKLPDEISMLQGLMRLDLTNNSISSLPHSLCTLAHLVSLHVEGNPIKSIRRDIIACGTHRILKTLRDRHNQSPNADRDSICSPTIPDKEFPDKYAIKKTKGLVLHGKNLIEIPEQVFEEASEADISIVDLSKNKLTQLPDGLSQLCTKLAELNMNSNALKEIPASIKIFENLKYLDISCNQLESLPVQMSALKGLRELNISNNRFVTFPMCIYDIVSLEILLACSNKIEDFDASGNGLAKLTRLATLDLSNNNISTVPLLLGNMTHLTTLLIHGNSFRAPRIQILEKGTSSILSYLRDRLPKEY
jgi:Leucine-rich repeat (LRR) protein